MVAPVDYNWITKVSEVTAAGLNKNIYPLGMNLAVAGSEAERLRVDEALAVRLHVELAKEGSCS